MEILNIKLICLIIILVYVTNCQCDQSNSNSNESTGSSHKKNSTRYCGNKLVNAMRLICEDHYAEPTLKRSLDEPKHRLNRKYKIWKRRFNLKDTDLSKC